MKRTLFYALILASSMFITQPLVANGSTLTVSVTAGVIDACFPTVAAAEAAAIAATSVVVFSCIGDVDLSATTTGNCPATITVTATDACGSSGSVNYTTRIGNTPPNVVCFSPSIGLSELNGTVILQPSSVFNAAASSDNCSGGLTVVSIVPPSVNCSQVRQIVPVTVTVEDACGNRGTGISMVNVGIVISPTIPGFEEQNVGAANGDAVYEKCGGSPDRITLTARGSSTPTTDVQRFVYQEMCGNEHFQKCSIRKPFYDYFLIQLVVEANEICRSQPIDEFPNKL